MRRAQVNTRPASRPPRFAEFVPGMENKPVMAMVEITNRCNMACPICFSDADRVKRCCYAITAEEGVFSFCAFNNLYRFPS